MPPKRRVCPSSVFALGAEIRRLHGEAGQSILIGVGDGRIGVNFDTAKRIYVF